ncbi:Probable DNA primase large subunit [Linum grandiflorum]
MFISIFHLSPLWKVPFEEVPELVAGRRVFLSKGYAYLAMSQAIKDNLSQVSRSTNQTLPTADAIFYKIDVLGKVVRT